MFNRPRAGTGRMRSSNDQNQCRMKDICKSAKAWFCSILSCLNFVPKTSNDKDYEENKKRMQKKGDAE